ncbi:MAG TPA: hypothetical protein PKD96_03730 [Candidatus Absconditabacterales bacterium]|nr:hypothetical protein [Candidatus Absconditabacterales bacterium]HMT27390.1 hypothetical protein [Candidatus Absconditabacterales bacterium]
MPTKSRAGKRFHQGDDLTKKKLDRTKDGLKYEKREPPVNKKPIKKTTVKKGK